MGLLILQKIEDRIYLDVLDPKTTMTITFETKDQGIFTLELGTDSAMLTSNSTFVKTEVREDGYYHYTTTITNLPQTLSTITEFVVFHHPLLRLKQHQILIPDHYKFILYGDSREKNMLIGNQHIPLVNQMLQNHDPLDSISNQHRRHSGYS